MEHVKNSRDPKCENIWKIYQDEFPADQSPTIGRQIDFLDKGFLQLISIETNDNDVVGFMSVWQLDEFSFLEHMAIKRDNQGKGFGRYALKEAHSIFSSPIILEAERHGDSIDASRRIKFYERAGFHYNTQPYLQPPYTKDKKAVPFALMSSERKLSDEEFCGVRDILHMKVYGLKEPLV